MPPIQQHFHLTHHCEGIKNTIWKYEKIKHTCIHIYGKFSTGALCEISVKNTRKVESFSAYVFPHKYDIKSKNNEILEVIIM